MSARSAAGPALERGDFASVCTAKLGRALAILVVFFLQPRLERKQFRKRRVRVRRPFAGLFLPGAKTSFPALARAAAVLLSRLASGRAGLRSAASVRLPPARRRPCGDLGERSAGSRFARPQAPPFPPLRHPVIPRPPRREGWPVVRLFPAWRYCKPRRAFLRAARNAFCASASRACAHDDAAGAAARFRSMALRPAAAPGNFLPRPPPRRRFRSSRPRLRPPASHPGAAAGHGGSEVTVSGIALAPCTATPAGSTGCSVQPRGSDGSSSACVSGPRPNRTPGLAQVRRRAAQAVRPRRAKPTVIAGPLRCSDT